jgi:hypothetical protein
MKSVRSARTRCALLGTLPQNSVQLCQAIHRTSSHKYCIGRILDRYILQAGEQYKCVQREENNGRWHDMD